VSYLQNIDSFSGDNMGSLLELRVIRKDDVSAIPDPVDGVIYGDITLNAGKSLVTWNVTRSTPRHRSSNKGSMEGDYEEASLNFVIPKDQPAIRRMLQLAQEDEHIVLYKDANGQWKLFGSLDDPVRFRFSHDSGGSHSQRNAYSCEFYSEGAANTWFYDGSIPSPPVGTPPAIVRKSDGTILASLSPGQTFTITSGFSFGFRIE
jgi:hypothetical protein